MFSGCVLLRTEQTAERSGDRQRRRRRTALEPLLDGTADRNVQEPQIRDRRPSRAGRRVVPDHPGPRRRKTSVAQPSRPSNFPDLVQVLKLWSVERQQCLQTLRVAFPSFGILGKFVEWGTSSIYPGPKRSGPGT